MAASYYCWYSHWWGPKKQINCSLFHGMQAISHHRTLVKKTCPKDNLPRTLKPQNLLTLIRENSWQQYNYHLATKDPYHLPILTGRFSIIIFSLKCLLVLVFCSFHMFSFYLSTHQYLILWVFLSLSHFLLLIFPDCLKVHLTTSHK